MAEVTRFLDGIAVCHPCYMRATTCHREILTKLIALALIDGEISAADGLQFWTYRPHIRPQVALTAGWIQDPPAVRRGPISMSEFRELRRLATIQLQERRRMEGPARS